MTDAKRYSTKFGAALDRQLKSRHTTQRAIAAELGRSAQYVNHTMVGRKPASPQWVDLVADVLGLPESDRVALHTAAAKDAGYRLDLTSKEG